MMKLILPGNPITKKNSQQIVYAGVRPMIVPSKQYKAYRDSCLKSIPADFRDGIDYPINLKAVYYMPTDRRVDLCNLLEATCDILTDAGVIKDDNAKIVVSHDGSRVVLDRKNPRVEIEIAEVVGYEEEPVKGIQPF